MKAILLAAGFGTRLRPLTENIPKCLVPIKNTPLLQIWLDHLNKVDVTNFLINTHYLSCSVQDYIRKSKYRDQVRLTYEPELLGTAGTLIANINYFDKEDGMLIHADNFCMANLDEFIAAHKNRPAYCLMTMMTFRTNKPSSCGIVELDNNGVVINFYEKVQTPPGNLANGAVYILTDKLLSIIEKDYSCAKDFSTDIIPKLAGRIFTFETKETFIDIGTPEAYMLANNL